LLKKTAYLIAKTIEIHPFVDGNKRATALLVVLFLAINGKRLVASQDEFYDILLGIAKHELKEMILEVGCNLM
jgi:death-on-curing protein